MVSDGSVILQIILAALWRAWRSITDGGTLD